MSEQAYKELPPVPEGTGWAEVLEAAEKKLNAAYATIAALEKRIGELESAWDQLTKRHAEALTDLAAERQRREEAEGALREVETAGDRYMARQSAAAYFSRYPSEPPPSTTEAENRDV